MQYSKKDNLTDLVQALQALEGKPAPVKPTGTVINDNGEIITLGQEGTETK